MIFTAIDGGKVGFVEILIEGGADLNICDKKGTTPLILSSSLGKTEITQLLIDNGADESLVDKNGKKAIDRAKNPSTKYLLLSSALERRVE